MDLGGTVQHWDIFNAKVLLDCFQPSFFLLNATEAWVLLGFAYALIMCDSSPLAFLLHSQKQEEDQVEISNLQVGTYVFQLTVTDTAQQRDFTNITIVVLNAEQTEGEPEPTNM